MDKGIATLRAQNGKMVSSSKGKREVLVEHYRKLGTPKPNTEFDTEFDTEFEKEINTWAEPNVEASKREDSGSKELQRVYQSRSRGVCSKTQEQKGSRGRRNSE